MKLEIGVPAPGLEEDRRVELEKGAIFSGLAGIIAGWAWLKGLLALALTLRQNDGR